MTNTFLKAKHWQLFVVIFAIPMLAMMIVMSSMAAKMPGLAEAETTPILAMEQVFTTLTSMMQAFGLILTFTILTLWGWYWSVCTGLQEKIPQDVKMNVKKFGFFYVIGFLYSLFFVGLIIFVASYLPKIISGLVLPSILSWAMPILGILHLFAVFCMFYCVYFAAKTIKTAELQRETTFSDFIGEFLLIWFFPIGVWILQAKINELVEADSSSEDMDWLDEY